MTTRANPRYAIRLSAEVSLGGELHTGMTRNLSAGGVCVEIARPLDEGATLAVTLFLVEDEIEAEGARALALKGTVQWTAEADRGFAIGIKFVDMSPAQTKALQNALTHVGEG